MDKVQVIANVMPDHQKPLPPPESLLVIPLRFIGDTVLTVPLLRNLRAHFPHSRIDVLASPPSAPLLAYCPYINQLALEPSLPKALISQIKAGQYDTAIILRKSFTMAYQCRQAGIKRLVGYDKQRFAKPVGFQRWGLLLNYRIRYPDEGTTTHQVNHHLSHLNAFQREAYDDFLELWPSPESHHRIHKLFQELGVDPNVPLAVLHTVSTSSGKTLAAEHVYPSVQTVSRSGFQWLCTGLKEDYPLYETLRRETGIPIHNLCGKTSLADLTALFQHVQLMLTVDSGPIHLAAAANVKTIIGIYNLTSPYQWGPYSKNNRFYPVMLNTLSDMAISRRLLDVTNQALATATDHLVHVENRKI